MNVSKVLIACHQPIRDGPVLRTSFREPFFIDYVDPVSEETLQTNGWTLRGEYGNLWHQYTSENRENSHALIGAALDKIRELRKGTYSSALTALRELPGHQDTKLYSKSDWSDIPDNTYDFVHAIHCPIYFNADENGNFSIKESRFLKITDLLRQSLRVLKPGGSLTFLGKTENYNPLNDPALTIPGFAIDFKKMSAWYVDEKFPEFWVSKDETATGYVMVNGELEERKMFLNENPDVFSNRVVVKLTKQPQTQEDIEAETLAAMRTGGRKTYRMPRKYSKTYCKKTTCRKMGFTQRSSCRPYKNCFRFGRRGGSGRVSR